MRTPPAMLNMFPKFADVAIKIYFKMLAKVFLPLEFLALEREDLFEGRQYQPPAWRYQHPSPLRSRHRPREWAVASLSPSPKKQTTYPLCVELKEFALFDWARFQQNREFYRISSTHSYQHE